MINNLNEYGLILFIKQLNLEIGFMFWKCSHFYTK